MEGGGGGEKEEEGGGDVSVGKYVSFSVLTLLI